MLLKGGKPKVFLVRLFFGEAMGEQPGDAAGKSTVLPVISVHTPLTDRQCHWDLTEHEHTEPQVSLGGNALLNHQFISSNKWTLNCSQPTIITLGVVEP